MIDTLMILMTICMFLFAGALGVLSIKKNEYTKDLCRKRLEFDLATDVEIQRVGRIARVRHKQYTVNFRMETARRQSPEYNAAVIAAKLKRTIEILRRLLKQKVQTIKVKTYRLLVLDTETGYNKIVSKIIIRGSREGKERITDVNQ